jgi:ribosomal protein S18 acetylase RimI-like enzyme
MDFTIEPMVTRDYEEVVALWKNQEGIGLNESDEREPIKRYLSRNPDMSFVARNHLGAIIGAVLCGHDGRRGYLHHLAVEKVYRRRGLGNMLVERCLAQLAAAGLPKCNIFLFNDNESGRRFWDRMGYRAVSWSPMQRVIKG